MDNTPRPAGSDPKDDAVAERWFAEFDAKIQPYADSHYVNEVNGAYPERIRNSFSKDSWDRLANVRRKYDPDNRFFSYLGQE